LIGPSGGPKLTDPQLANGIWELGSGSGTGVPVGTAEAAGAEVADADEDDCATWPVEPDVLEPPQPAIAKAPAARRAVPNFINRMGRDYPRDSRCVRFGCAA
jgi:hypothetical protein